MKKSFKYFLAYSFITLLLLSLDIFLLTRKKKKKEKPKSNEKACLKFVSQFWTTEVGTRLYKEPCGNNSLYKVHKMDNPVVTGMSFLYVRNLVDIIPSTKYIKMDNPAVTGMSFLLD